MIKEADVRQAVALLPEHSWIRQYVTYAENITDSHLFYHVAVALSTLSVTCSHALTGRGIGFKADTFPNFYAWVVGLSGEAEKSLAIDVGTDLLRAYTDGLIGPAPTAETVLLKVLSITPNQLFVYSEGGKFLSATSGGIANPGGQTLRKGFTEAYDGKPYAIAYSVDKGRPSFSVEAPRPSFLGGCTPADLEEFTLSVDWEAGFMSRFFFAYGMPERHRGEPLEQPERKTWLGSWLARSAIQSETGQCVGIDAGAKAHYDAWLAAYRERYAKESQDPTLAGVLSRARLFVFKIAVLICWSTGRGWGTAPWWISEVEMRAATALVDLHLRCAINLCANVQPSIAMREQQRLLRSIGTTWTSQGEALRLAKLTIRQATPYFATLVVQGLIAEETQGATLYYRRIPNGSPREYDNDFVFEPAPTFPGVTS